MASISEKTIALKTQNASKSLAVLTTSLAASLSPSQSPLGAGGGDCEELVEKAGESRKGEGRTD